MKGVQCYELYGGIALKNHAFSFFISFEVILVLLSLQRLNLLFHRRTYVHGLALLLTAFLHDALMCMRDQNDPPSRFDVKSFPRQSRSRGGGIATVSKSTLNSNITIKTNLEFTHTSFEVVQASTTIQHNTLHFFCLCRPPPNRRNNLTDSMLTEQLPDLLDYVGNLQGFVCLVGDMNSHFDNPLQSLTKQTLTTLCLYDLVQVINKPTHRCGHITDWVIFQPDDDIHKKSSVVDSLESDHYCTK